MTISKWVNLIFAGIAIIAFIVLDKALIWGGTSLLTQNFLENALLGSYVKVHTVIAVALSVGLTLYLYRQADIFSYLSEVVIELQRVTWPSMDETRRSTIVVIVFTVLLSVYLAVFDYIWKIVTDFLITPGA